MDLKFFGLELKEQNQFGLFREKIFIQKRTSKNKNRSSSVKTQTSSFMNGTSSVKTLTGFFYQELGLFCQDSNSFHKPNRTSSVNTKISSLMDRTSSVKTLTSLKNRTLRT